MDKRKPSGTAVILYFGVGIQTTPKIQLIKSTLEKQYREVIISGVTAMPFEPNSPNRVIPITSKSPFSKVALSVLAIIKITIWLNRKSPDLIYAINPIPGLLAAILNKLKKTSYIYETLEIFCGIEYFPYSKRYRSIWYAIERFTIKNSLKTFTTDEFRVKFLRRLFRIKNNKIHYTYNTNSKASFLSPPSKSTTTTISYCGGVYPGRQIEEIVSALALLKKSTPDIRLIIAGGGNTSYIEKIKSQTEELKVSDSVEFTGSISNEKLKSIMSESTITFAFYKRDSLNNRLNSPNKIFDSIFCRTSLVTTDSPLSRKIIKSNGTGELIKTVSDEIIAEKCQEILKNGISDSRFEKLIEELSWESEEKKILNIITPLEQ